jgi:tRNA A37 threonylcarbamoyladenosine dehydratase
MEERFSRTALMIGEEAVEKLRSSRVAIFGVGGVGSFAAEAIARMGVGSITLVDNDTVAPSNLNRQLIALHSTLGRNKVDVAKERILDINPDANVDTRAMFYLPENADEIDISSFDCIVDAIDTVSAKIEIIVRADRAGVPVVSSMGTGNKLHPEMLELTDISKTSVCPLARVMRRELKSRGINHLPVVYSKEEPVKLFEDVFLPNGKKTVGSISFVPSSAGLLIASKVLELLIKK